MEDISAAHLVTLPSFINYCYSTNEADMVYWERYLSEHPEKAAVIAEAKDMLKMGGWIMRAEKGKAAALNKLDAYLNNPPAIKRKPIITYLTAAASVAALIVLIFVLFRPGSHTAPLRTQVYQTTGQARKGFVLPDKSFILLENGAAITLEPGFGQQERTIRLQGTAYFNVAKDHQRPFSVKAGDYIITALGTAFRVSTAPGSLQVLLEEGRVKVEQENRDGRTLIAILQPSDKLDIHPNQASTAPAARSTFSRTELSAWKAQEIVFVNTPLEEVVQQLNACYNINITLEGINLKTETFSGRFKNDQLTSVLDVLCFTLNKRYEIRDSTNIIIH